MKPPNAIDVVNCSTAEHLVAFLRADDSRWRGQRYFWAFRGIEDDRFELLPKALRTNPPAQLGYTFAPKVGPRPTNRLRVAAEFERLHEFFWTADAQGLAIPGDSHLVRTPAGWREMKNREASLGWPTDDLLPVAALAQHYGIGTRLLDWTEKPLVGAYFAARRAAEAPSNGATHVGLWALNFDWVIHRAWPGKEGKIAVFVVTAPRASNPNLHAQGGIFTAEKIVKEELDLPTSTAPIDELVSDRFSELDEKGPAVMIH